MTKEIVHQKYTTATKFDWRRYDPDLYPSPNEPMWLRLVYSDEFGIVELEEARATSERPTAQTMRSSLNEIVTMTEVQARWLHQALGKLLELRDKKGG